MSVPYDAQSSPARGPVTAVRLIVGGSILAVAAAVLLWLRFGPSVFTDALSAVWTCL